ncbi:alpha-mannosidase [Alkalicoccobacillus gibsonii]|uniref:alpha-mannosidase n=1 Tax=Alkalicoccobacillus gibsonii TaxID=79881 RepID=UPI003513C29E
MQQIRRCIQYVGALVHTRTEKTEDWQATRAYYKQPGEYEFKDPNPFTIKVGDKLIESGETLFIENELIAPPSFEGEYGIEFKVGQHGIPTNHEGLVYLDGVPYHGIDRNRSYIPLPKQKSYHLKIELFNPTAQVVDQLNFQNAPAEFDPAPLYLLESKWVQPNIALEDLYYTMKVYYESAILLPEEGLTKQTLLGELLKLNEWIQNTSKETLLFQPNVIEEKKKNFLQSIEKLDVNDRGTMHMVGQSHIDLAWLWPMKEAVRKTSRTFSTMSTLLDQYSNFTYAQSQPQAYEYVKTYFPELYKRVKKHVEDGRWEIVGGMWVEPDLNIPSGESLVRQLIYGMEFFKDEFNVRPTIEWLPDTFGYCASLPQLLKKSGMDYFMTTKMNWNDTNPFPYDLFHWEGIDGTSILSYLNHGINEYTHPKEIKEHWDSFKQKKELPEQMLLYGHGDGGGGVTKEMLEYVKRSESLPGLPLQKNSTAHEFFNRAEKVSSSLPKWVGDLYLELHRGTYTTHAKNKRWNRRAEVLYREAEMWSVLAPVTKREVDTRTLKEGWKLLLFNQFHDIIPGTSIPEVYVKSEEDYKEVFSIGQKVKDEAMSNIAKEMNTEGDGQPYVLFNSLSWDRDEIIELSGGRELLNLSVYDENNQELKSDLTFKSEDDIHLSFIASNIPQMGYKTVWLRPTQSKPIDDHSSVFNGSWETSYYLIEWNDNGELSRLYDKSASREVLLEGELANQFQLFHDQPTYWDAWDIDPKFNSQEANKPKLVSVEVALKGETKDVLRFQWTVSESVIWQNVIFYHHSSRIDFQTKVDWKETHKLLKVAFPVDIQTTKATYEIPFGAIERATHTNTSWEHAQFEVCGHRFADLSEGAYGVSLLNDCKYGYDVKGKTIRLSLLRAPKWPDPTADQGEHHFTYSLCPHQGNWIDANVTRKGYELNHPISIYQTDCHKGSLPSQKSFIQTDTTHGIIDTVKRSENGKGVALRLYESSGSRESFTIHSDLLEGKVFETNLLEEQPQEVVSDRYSLVPFEVKTVVFESLPFEVEVNRGNEV